MQLIFFWIVSVCGQSEAVIKKRLPLDAAAENLLKISKWIGEDQKAKVPDVLCVICGMREYADTRPDGVMVIPITALKN